MIEIRNIWTSNRIDKSRRITIPKPMLDELNIKYGESSDYIHVGIEGDKIVISKRDKKRECVFCGLNEDEIEFHTDLKKSTINGKSICLRCTKEIKELEKK